MAFRRSTNAVEAWAAFCRRHGEKLERLPRLASAVASADRFDQYLQTGAADEAPSLSSLDDDEWRALASFVTNYADDWQSWFVRSMYVAYYEELDRRTES